MTDDAELKDLFMDLMRKQLEPAADELMAQFDKNGDGVIEFSEFMPADLPLPDEAKAEMIKQFQNMDINKDGKVERHEIMTFMENAAMETALPMITEQLT
jgi:Ca2+-binding EF-hand superfamily protein